MLQILSLETSGGCGAAIQMQVSMQASLWLGSIFLNTVYAPTIDFHGGEMVHYHSMKPRRVLAIVFSGVSLRRQQAV